MKRIIITATSDINYDQRMIRIASSLTNAGYDVLFTGHKKYNSNSLLSRAYEQKRIPTIFRKGKLFYIEYNIRLLVFLLFAKFDIVYSVDLDTILPGLFASMLKRKERIFDAHEYFTELPEVINRPVTKKVWEMVAGFTIPKYKKCITVCDSIAEILSEKYRCEFVTIRNLPYHQKNSSQQETQEKSVIIYQGVLNVGRGLEQMIEAMKSLPDMELWIAGEGDLSKKLRLQADSSPAKNRIKFLGKINPEELKKITPKAAIGLNLLENMGKNYYYSLANKTFDYIQAGIPTINMNFPEYKKLNEKYDIFVLIDHLKIQTIIAAIKDLKENKILYNKLTFNNLKAKEELIWENEMNKVLQVVDATGS